MESTAGTILIAAYKEETLIEEKIENTLSLDYPNESFKLSLLPMDQLMTRLKR